MWVCYTLPEARQRLWLTSSEIGGRQYINGATAEVVTDLSVRVTPDCPALPPRYRPVRFDSDLWLGDRSARLAKRLGQPTDIYGPVRLYAYEKPQSRFDVSSILAVRLNGGRIVALYASHLTTN